MTNRDKLTEKCIHCGRCTSVCEFLTKYGLDLDGFNSREDLAYSCYLCGDCKRVCPVDIDGREISLIMRDEKVSENKGKTDSGYGLVKLEKRNYKFKSYKKSKGKSVLYPGCNFLSFYPKTSDKLIEMLSERGIGVIFDCCTKPISELGLESDSVSSVDLLNKHILENNIEELIMVCPNCYYFLKDKINAKCISIYKKLDELGLGKKLETHKKTVERTDTDIDTNIDIDKDIDTHTDADKEIDMHSDADLERGSVYIPCPDRTTNELYWDLNIFTDIESYRKAEAQCCGLGGLAIVKEPELSEKMNKKLRDSEGKIHTYCATCAGNINNKSPGKAVHFLTEILDINEESSRGLKTVFNRSKYKYK